MHKLNLNTKTGLTLARIDTNLRAVNLHHGERNMNNFLKISLNLSVRVFTHRLSHKYFRFYSAYQHSGVEGATYSKNMLGLCSKITNQQAICKASRCLSLSGILIQCFKFIAIHSIPHRKRAGWRCERQPGPAEQMKLEPQRKTNKGCGEYTVCEHSKKPSHQTPLQQPCLFYALCKHVNSEFMLFFNIYSTAMGHLTFKN